MEAVTIPEEFLTRVDFGKCWKHLFGPIESAEITRERLQSVKRAMLDAGVPTWTVSAYFDHLGRVVANELGDEGDALYLVERVLSELEEMAHREVEANGW